jgi:hypothetical protein
MVALVPRVGAVLFTAAILSSCTARTERDPDLPRVQRNIITYDMAVETRATNAYEIVLTLRSNWLQPRGVDSFTNPGQVQVYFNSTRLGGVNTLSSIPLSQIGYIEYFNPTDAAAIWGLDHGHGVIAIRTLAPD